MLKKLSAVIFTVILVAGTFFSMPSEAKDKDSNASKAEVLFEKQEIKDEEALFNRAKKGITDDKTLERKLNSSSELKGKSKDISVKIYNTTELLKKVKNKDGSIENIYKTTAFAPISSKELALAAGGSDYDYDTDDSISVRAANTYYYTTSSYDGKTHLDMTSANGSWSILDSQVRISNRKVVLGQTGPSKAGCGTCNDPLTKYPTSNSFSYSAPSWVPVYPSSYTSLGVSQYVTITRGSESWSFPFHNRY